MATVIIGIAELAVVRPPDSVSTLGLGSCCGVVIFDKVSKISGMVHVMLPTASAGGITANRAKYADTGVQLLAEELVKAGANRMNLVAKIAGGAHMFSSTAMSGAATKIGERNVNTCQEMLKKMRILLLTQDVLGTHGRTITFNPATSLLHVKRVGAGEKYI